jgi:hypothetical protein
MRPFGAFTQPLAYVAGNVSRSVLARHWRSFNHRASVRNGSIPEVRNGWKGAVTKAMKAAFDSIRRLANYRINESGLQSSV